MADKWPWIEDWKERDGYDLDAVSEYIKVVVILAGSDFTPDDEHELNTYIWNSRSSPERVDRMYKKRTLADDLNRFSDCGAALADFLTSAYAKHKENLINAHYGARLT